MILVGNATETGTGNKALQRQACVHNFLIASPGVLPGAIGALASGGA